MTSPGEGVAPPSPEATIRADVADLPPSPGVAAGGSSRRTLRDASVRQALALLFFALFAGTVVLSFFRLQTSTWADTREWLQLMLPAETALLGSATGFYFGTRDRDQHGN